MDFFEHLRGIDFCTFLDFPTTCTVRNRPRVKILEDGRVSLYGELRKRAAEQQRDYCARISPDGRCMRRRRMLFPVATESITGNVFKSILLASFKIVILQNIRDDNRTQDENAVCNANVKLKGDEV